MMSKITMVVLIILFLLVCANHLIVQGLNLVFPELPSAGYLKIIYLIIGIVASVLLLYAIIKEYGLFPPLEQPKTDYQIQCEKEREEKEKEEEELRIQREKEEKLKEKEREVLQVDRIPADRSQAKKQSKLG